MRRNPVFSPSTISPSAAPVLCALVLLSLVTTVDGAGRPEPRVYGVIDGDTVYAVLPPNAIPAIRSPRFLPPGKGDAQMEPEEPVMGVVIGGEARAYSLWQLDSHEIVDDVIAGTPIAVTW